MTLFPNPETLDKTSFVAAYGGVYEHSSWVAESVWEALGDQLPHSAIKLSVLMAAAMAQANDEIKLALLRAHPDLAGKAAIAGVLTDESRSEQAGAGLDQCSKEEFERFQTLNAAYTNRFGFPFIVAVKGLTRHDILNQFEIRLNHARDVEFQTALAQVNKIARLRLCAMEDET